MIDMLVAKDRGLDNAEPRTPEATTPTSFRQWCEAVLKPAAPGQPDTLRLGCEAAQAVKARLAADR